MKIEKFEDLEVWQLSRELVKLIYKMSDGMISPKDYSFINQIQRSSISIMSNIAEGFERKGTKEYMHFLYMAKGSCGELRSLLYVALDLSYVNQKQFNEIYVMAEKISKSLGGLIKYLKSLNLESSNR